MEITKITFLVFEFILTIASTICIFINNPNANRIITILLAICSLTLTIVFLFFYYRGKKNTNKLLSMYKIQNRLSMDEVHLNDKVSINFLLDLREKIHHQIDIIQTVSEMMEKPEKYTKSVAYAKVIQKHCSNAKNILGYISGTETINETTSEKTSSIIKKQEQNILDAFTTLKNSTLCIFGNTSNIEFLLRFTLMNEGFFCIASESFDEILHCIKNDKIQLLIINPDGVNDICFDLCIEIRKNFNLLKLPIIMILDYFEGSIVNRGLYCGVNDFLIRPYDSSELISRCYSQLKQKDVYFNE